MPIAKRKRALGIIIIAALLIIGGSVSFIPGTGTAIAEAENPCLVRTFVDEEGRQIDEVIVPGRPPEIKASVAAVPEPNPAMGINTLSNVPAFDWCYGCSATSAAMMFGHYDNHNYTNMYAGPTNGGVCPMTNSVWGSGECPLSATHQGYDGLGQRGHVDDYWSFFGSTIDPYFGNWAQHTYADCTADYMGTNQYHNWNNTDGGTWFYFYTNGDPLYDFTLCEGWTPPERDGCHGVRLFVESRGYTVITNFNQYIKGQGSDPTKGFTFSDFQSEIDAGRPVLIQVVGHTMLGYGYNTAGSIIYIHDTWDYSNHSMTWGETYFGMQHKGVTVIRLGSPMAPSVTTNGASGITGNSATLNGNLGNLGTAPTASVSFEWGKTTSYGNTTTPESKSTTGAFSFALGSLSPNTTYHFRAKAIGDGTGYGLDKSFCTLAPVHNLTVNVTPSGGGDIKVNDAAQGSYPYTYTFNDSQLVDLKAVPASGYHFLNWSGDVGTVADVNSANTTINMTGNYSIVANFAINRYNLTISSTSGGSVTTPGEGVSTYDAGTVVDLVATADANYHFVNWTTANMSEIANATAASTTVTVDENKTVTANFAEVTGAILEGHVSFISRGTNNSKWAEPFLVRGFEPGNLTNELWNGNATTNNTGVFTMNGLAPGTYDIGIKNCTALSEVNTSVTLSAGMTTVVNFGTTREGDADGDDTVTGTDFSLLAGAFMSIPAYPNWNPNCDFNRNNAVTGKDFSLLSGNFGKAGPLQPY